MRTTAVRFGARGPGSLYRRYKSLEYLATRDRAAALDLVCAPELSLGLGARLRLVTRFVSITNAVRGYHTLAEMLAVARAILARERPSVLEAGSGYGSSTAKLSVATSLAEGRLVVCDSFRGIPPNEERHELLDGRPTAFRAGAFRGRLASVKRVVERHGEPGCCRFVKGWFEDVLPALEPELRLDVVVCDVDLVGSTRTCLRELWPRLRPGGVLFSLDGQLRGTHALLGDPDFWRIEVGDAPPRIDGLGREKLLVLHRGPDVIPKGDGGR